MIGNMARVASIMARCMVLILDEKYLGTERPRSYTYNIGTSPFTVAMIVD